MSQQHDGTAVSHPAGRHYQVRGHRLWVETEGDGEPLMLLASEPGARNTELYPLFVGADVDFIVGGEVARIPDFRPRLKEITVPVMVLAGRYDRALYPALQRQFTDYAPQIRLEFLKRSGSFSHVEEPGNVFALVRDFTGDERDGAAGGTGHADAHDGARRR
jgi:pimeloyl-ACP methyl ester carboxylesterase